MKSILPVALLSILSSYAIAQSRQQQKTDSICQLVQRYFNKQAYDSLYDLTAPVFRMRVSAHLFENVSLEQYTPLGAMKRVTLKKFSYGDAWYNVQFDTTRLTLILRADENGKLEFFRLKKGKQNDHLLSNNLLQTPLDEEVEAGAQRIMMQEQSVGLSMGILINGKTYFYGYGQADKQNGTMPDSSTVFELASVTKVFTATLIANAVEEGKLQLNNPVNNFLPDSVHALRFDNKSVTIKDLANHTGGTPFMPLNFDSSVVRQAGSNEYYSIEQLNSFLKNVQINHKPGTVYQYSNAGFAILADVLINRYHTSYQKIIEHKVLKPLNLQDTKTFIAQSNQMHMAKGYNEDGVLVQSWDHRPVLIGHGGLASSACDMLKFANVQIKLANTTLGKAIALTQQLTYSDKEVKMGLGWTYIQPGKNLVLHHAGGTAGYNSYFAIDKNNKTAIIIMTNSPIALLQDGDLLIKNLKR